MGEKDGSTSVFGVNYAKETKEGSQGDIDIKCGLGGTSQKLGGKEGAYQF